MRIFKFRCDTDNFKTIDVDDCYFELLDQFQTRYFENDWTPLPINFVGELPMADIMQIDYRIPVFREHVLRDLDLSIDGYIEYLNLENPQGDCFALNIYPSVDCLNESKSDIRKNHFGNIVEVRNGIFSHEAIKLHGIFTIPSHGVVYLTEPIIEKIYNSEYSGLLFTEVGYAE